MRKLFVLFSLFVLQANAQHINWVKQSFNKAKNLGVGTPGAWVTPNGSFFYINSYGASAQTDTGTVFQGSDEENAVVSFIDANGMVLNQFNIEGVYPPTPNFSVHALRYSVLNDTEVVFLAPTQNVYVNGVKKTDSLIFNSYYRASSLYKLSNTGVLSSIITLPIVSFGHIKYGMGMQIGQNNNWSLSVDTITQRAFIMFGCSESVDTAVFDTNYIKPNTTSVLQVNLVTGAIDKHWTFPGEFDGMGVLGDDIILSGRSQGFNYSYTIDGTTYARDSSADLNTNDVLIASFNTVTNGYNWHKMFKIKSPYRRINLVTSYAVGPSVYVQVRHQDTVTIDGVTYGNVIPFNTQEYDMVVAINTAGVKWANDFKYGQIQSVFKATNQPSGVSYSVYAASDLTMNAMPIPKTISNGYNYIAVTESGALDRSFNAGFKATKNKGEIFGVNYADSTLIVGVNLTDTDSLLLNGTYYTKKHKGGYFGEDLLLSFKSSAGQAATGLRRVSKDEALIKVYPNPATSYLMFTGVEPQQAVTIGVYDLTGKRLIYKNQKPTESIDVSSLSTGIYFLQVQTETIHQTIKFLVH